MRAYHVYGKIVYTLIIASFYGILHVENIRGPGALNVLGRSYYVLRMQFTKIIQMNCSTSG